MPTYYAGDNTDMASLTDYTVSGRFRFARRESVESITVWFTGAAGTADIYFYRHRFLEGHWGLELIWQEKARGTGADCLLTIPPGDPRADFFTFDAENDLVVLWANPDSGNIQWIITVRTRIV